MPVLVISHRTNAATCPENTLHGIDAAIADGAHAIEVDVRATADGTPVLMHDATLQRTAGDPRTLASVSLHELRALRVLGAAAEASEPVPTLEEAIDRARGRAALVLDICEPGLEEGIAAVVRRTGTAGDTWVTTHDAAEAERFRDLLPGARILLSVGRREGADDPVPAAIDVVRARHLDGINPDHRLLRREHVEAAREHGLWVSTWTVNTRADAARVLAMGVDSVCGDDPRMLLAAAERLRRLPA